MRFVCKSLFFGATGLRLEERQMALYRHLNQILFGFGLLRAFQQLSQSAFQQKRKNRV
jgi:hypothetical protein